MNKLLLAIASTLAAVLTIVIYYLLAMVGNESGIWLMKILGVEL